MAALLRRKIDVQSIIDIPKYIEDLDYGETGYLADYELLADKSGRLYIFRNWTYMENRKPLVEYLNEKRGGYIEITKMGNGFFGKGHFLEGFKIKNKIDETNKYALELKGFECYYYKSVLKKG